MDLTSCYKTSVFYIYILCILSSVSIIVFDIVQSSQLAARVLINDLHTYLLTYCLLSPELSRIFSALTARRSTQATRGRLAAWLPGE